MNNNNKLHNRKDVSILNLDNNSRRFSRNMPRKSFGTRMEYHMDIIFV